MLVCLRSCDGLDEAGAALRHQYLEVPVSPYTPGLHRDSVLLAALSLQDHSKHASLDASLSAHPCQRTLYLSISIHLSFYMMDGHERKH